MIFYFSGTGNCLNIAKKTGERLKESVRSLLDATSLNISTERCIGFVFPTYNFLAPKIVTDTISKLDLPKSAYYFVIGVVGAQVGNSIWQVKKILEGKGCRLSYSNKIRVPDNSAIAFGRNPNSQTWKFTRFARRWDSILCDLEQHKNELHYAWWDPLAAITNQPFLAKFIYNSLRPDTNTENCTGCGICVKVCPVKNITMRSCSNDVTDKKVACHDKNCEFCLACVHICPVQATEFSHKQTIKERQYHHPEVNWKELMK